MPLTLTIVVPAFNEAPNLPIVLAEIDSYRRRRDGVSIVVVDDGSVDCTPDILGAYAGREGFTVVRHKVNRGYGWALKAGISEAKTDLVVTIDGDGQHRLEDVDAMVAVLEAQDADLVVGNRTGRDSTTMYRRMGKWVIRMLTRILVGARLRDLNSGCKLYRTVLVQKYLCVCPDSMAFSDVIALVFLSQRHRVAECPIVPRPRRAGKGTITTATAFETLLEILNIIMLFNPLRIFLPISFVCLIAGLGWGVPIILLGRGVSVGSMLAVVMALTFFFLGLVADQLSHIRKERIRG